MGQQYIDVGLSLYSFIPNDLNKNLKKNLRYYLNNFRKKPYFYYDKIESELILSSIDFSTNEKLRRLKKFNFSDVEILQIKRHYKTLQINLSIILVRI